MSNADSNNDDQANNAQVRSLLDSIYERYGWDFRNYAIPSIRRRIETAMRAENLASISQLERRLLVDPACMERFVGGTTVNVTSMFRDPDFYRVLRFEVAPHLRQRPFLKIWHAGCSTGEEVISVAILLREEGLVDRCRIYATDINAEVLDKAKQGIFSISSLKEYSRNYIAAGGRQAFSDYYRAKYEHVMFERALTSNIVFSQHNLVSDGAFSQFDLILCRNVVIYFNQQLADHVHQLLYDSLLPAGFLCLGSSEMIRFTPHESCYDSFHTEQRIYQRRI